MAECNAVSTPMVSGCKLSKVDETPDADQTMYRSMIVVQRIFKYINGTLDFGLWYPRNDNFTLLAYIDANWAGCVDDRKITNGAAFFLGDILVTWDNKKQDCISLSITEFEYVATTSCCTQLLWMAQTLLDMGRIIGISESDTGSISIVESTASDGIVGVVDTTGASNIANGVIDVVVATDGVDGLIGGMIVVLDGIVGILSHIGAIGAFFGAVDIIKDMGNACQFCTSHPSVMSPPHDEGSSLPSPPPIIPSSPLPISTTFSPPLSIDSLIQSIKQVNPTDEIDSLLNFIEDRLRRIKGTPEKASTSSSLLDSVTSTTTLAAKVVDTITTEAEKLASMDIAKEMGSLALSGLKMVGEAHWILLGLSVAACALERCVTVTSNVSDCIDLLQAIAFLAKDLKQFKEAMPGESKRLCQAVQMIVEGAVMCCDYINKERLSRYWSATTTLAQLEKTNQSIRDIRTSLGLPLNLQILQNTKQLLRKATVRFEESPLRLLEFEPVGIEEKVAEVKALLDMEGTEPAVAVVLCGFGGVGKSTLAASVIQNLYLNHPQSCADFKFCRVIIDDKSADVTSHIMKLQQDIIYDFGGVKQDLRNPQEGHLRLQDVMENKSCLLFIDNVVDKRYVHQLLPENLLWFDKSKTMSAENLGKSKTKLRIFITSREKNLISKLSITYKEYDVNAFSNETARIFLRETILHSDGQLKGDFDENAFINDVADACRGVPILLSVFGKHLRGDREKASYKEALKALHEGNPDGFAKEENLSKQLFFVYSKLEKEDQEAFLDICKYFYGWEWDLVCKILDESTVKTLESKMLINKGDSGVVIVHDVLRLMGEKEAEHTRISNYKKLLQVTEDEADLRNIKGISLVGNETLVTVETRHLNATCKSLRVLMIGDWVNFNGPLCNRTFQNLRYLSVGDTIHFPFEDTLKLHNLRAFFNRSKDGMNLPKLPRSLRIISHHVPHPYGQSFEALPLQNLLSLQSFIVETRMLVKLPAKFGFPASLLDLKLNCCGQLPKDISILASLERLNLDKCHLEVLPQGIGELKKLKHLSLQDCTKLASLPQDVGLLSSMTCLRLQGCTLLQNLPDDLGKLSALEELSTRDCENLRELPQGFGGLSSLQNLDLTGCIALKRLPESFAKLRIESLNLQSLLSLDELPSCFGNMPCLSHLKLIYCNSLSTLPNSFVHLTCLQTLEINDCSSIVALPGDFGQLSLLSEMTVEMCPKLKELPHGFQALTALKKLKLICCSSLVSLPSGFGELICLESLYLEGLLISSLPEGFGNLQRLDFLRIRLCFKLEKLPDDFDNLASLTMTYFNYCPELDGAAMERIIKLRHCDKRIRSLHVCLI
ncbi:disease resistance protein TAO1-like [Cryptomeria japonica]|uniref:disease resistance protein TAO1-like n=1 Tax=Cryptomeria japonica TaxID=3369 RepID=UPI0027DA8DCD|nr:disease resistance protein TAO1-like [Cryptomeria japonica]